MVGKGNPFLNWARIICHQNLVNMLEVDPAQLRPQVQGRTTRKRKNVAGKIEKEGQRANKVEIKADRVEARNHVPKVGREMSIDRTEINQLGNLAMNRGQSPKLRGSQLVMIRQYNRCTI